MVAVANPRTERVLMTLASALAQHDDERVLATHIVTIPVQTALATVVENRKRIDAASEDLLTATKADAERFEVPIETKTIFSHRRFEEVFDTARTNNVDTVVMGYGGARFAGGRAEDALDELTHDLPCDFLVLDGQELDDVLVPTAGGDRPIFLQRLPAHCRKPLAWMCHYSMSWIGTIKRLGTNSFAIGRPVISYQTQRYMPKRVAWRQ